MATKAYVEKVIQEILDYDLYDDKEISNYYYDCPELSNTGLLRAVNKAKIGSRIYVYTDASVKDKYLTDNVKAAAKRKGIYIKFFLSGSCSPIDPIYEEIARETGGQVVVLENTESAVDNSYALIEPELTGDLEPILIMEDTLGDTPIDTLFPVDSTMTSLVVNVITKGEKPIGLK